MTTDITELAQREKFEAWARSQKLGLSYGDCGYVFSSTEMAWRAWMTSSAELVEAMEKAQQRIAELEEAEQKLCAANVTLDARAELAERQLAALESRTVKLPKLKMLEDYLAEVAIEERKQILVGVKLEFHRALAAAGIKVEDE
ncbi:hypothetical protein RFC95_005165 [Klebsiella pneumoniae]|uniref:hypothetical protein n=1 Tax=Klebsiella pneumoniae TaxID=573 RepID=UPI00214D2C19|nr:hypothetical protein [Klebsiella pneumoniae]MED7661388.1 hypothetical protein [Klebsiella pneumoniae]